MIFLTTLALSFHFLSFFDQLVGFFSAKVLYSVVEKINPRIIYKSAISKTYSITSLKAAKRWS